MFVRTKRASVIQLCRAVEDLHSPDHLSWLVEDLEHVVRLEAVGELFPRLGDGVVVEDGSGGGDGLSASPEPLGASDPGAEQRLVVEGGVLGDFDDGEVVGAVEHLGERGSEDAPPWARRRGTPGSGTRAVRSWAGSRLRA